MPTLNLDSVRRSVRLEGFFTCATHLVACYKHALVRGLPATPLSVGLIANGGPSVAGSLIAADGPGVSVGLIATTTPAPL